MKWYLLVLLVALALLSGCTDGGKSVGVAKEGASATEHNSSVSTGVVESDEQDPGWLSGESTMTADGLLESAKRIPHHPLNPATQLPDEHDDALMQELWTKHADGKIAASKLLYTAIKEVEALEGELSCTEFPKNEESLTLKQRSLKWQQTAIQWLRNEHAVGHLTQEDLESLEERLILHPFEERETPTTSGSTT